MKDILELMEHFDRLSISEMELEYHGMKVFLKKDRKDPDSSLKKNEVIAESVSLISEAEKEVKEKLNPPVDAEQKEAKKVICAPLAGTFYRSPAPGEAPFVLPGQRVKQGEVLGVIEAMKMMNEIVADQDGIVEEILAEDESMVAFDEPLIVIR